MQQEAVEKDGRSEVVYVLVNGQQRSHHNVPALHYNIRYSEPKERPQEVLRRLADVHQVTRNEQEAGHVEGIYHLLGKGVKLLEVHQMETDDEQDKNTLQVVKLLYSPQFRSHNSSSCLSSERLGVRLFISVFQ